MNIKRMILSALIIGPLYGSNLFQEKTTGMFASSISTLGLQKQISGCRNSTIDNQIGDGVFYRLKKDKIETIVDFENSILKWLKGMERLNLDFASYIRLGGYVKGFIVMLQEYAPHLKNCDELIFDTPVAKWTQYKDIDLEDNYLFTHYTQAIIENIRRQSQGKKIRTVDYYDHSTMFK